MKWLVDHINWLIGFAGVWTLGNGILHDIFVLIQRRPYERELIHLLIDGHILIFSGIIYLICSRQMQVYNATTWWICIANALFMLGYCALIFKLLPAVGMILLHLLVLAVLLMQRFM